ncbi:MAG: M48 family metallopeptidase [Pseudomonadota bacterium]|nr:M48 family metallopeptidase [Pseudomonadota bacterium]
MATFAHTAAPAPAPRLPAQWFDGRTSRAQPVTLTLLPGPRGPDVLLAAASGQRLRVAHQHIDWPESWASPERAGLRALMLDLREHGSVQIDDIAAWQAALAAAGHRPSLAARMQTQLKVLLAVAVLAAGGLWAFHRWGTPWVATQLAAHVPLSWEQALAEQALQQIDKRWLSPSQLPPERQAELRAGFDRLAAAMQADAAHRPYRAYSPPLRLEFRSGMGANAFALPGGTIILTDGIVKSAHITPGTGDEALRGVMAHEIGHVLHRHTTRMVVEQGVLGIGLGLALGDVSSIVSTGASVLTGLAYSRSHERQADCYAMHLMRATGQSAAPMGTLLLALSTGSAGDTPAPHSGPGSSTDNGTGNSADSGSQPPSGLDWFSTHPDTASRAQRLRAGDISACG